MAKGVFVTLIFTGLTVKLRGGHPLHMGINIYSKNVNQSPNTTAQLIQRRIMYLTTFRQACMCSSYFVRIFPSSMSP